MAEDEPAVPVTSPAVVTKAVPGTVDEAVGRLEDLVAARGMKLFAVIDHSGEARAHGLELRDTRVVIFGSPVGGTPVMEAVPEAALDLPLKVLVWDDGGQTRVTYTSPAALAARYDVPADLAAPLAGIVPLTDALARFGKEDQPARRSSGSGRRST
jgi:uncharacterized protein (DUF302 family)